jgi:secondary thiamine-phosphate synthase enzyme
MIQHEILLREKARGFHLITDEILNAIDMMPETGLMHLFLQHTSAGICINENADPTVLEDMSKWFDSNIKENEPYYKHTFEGSDDMPAHIKSVLIGNQLQIPISKGKLKLGVWQGIYLGEFRNHGGNRRIVITIYT